MKMDLTDFLFYTDRIEEGRACLEGGEMHHAVTVLRRRIGDTIDFTDGKGHYYHGRITEIGRREAWVEIDRKENIQPPAYAIHICVAPTKQFERMAWCLEKLTELGVHRITPMICTHSERQKWNAERAQKILVSAMKQSRQVFLPICDPLLSMTAVLEASSEHVRRYIAMQDGRSAFAGTDYLPGSDVMILIGPEGDFSEQEKTLAIDQGFLPLSLGSHRLRTETAAVVAAATIHTLNQA